MTFANIFLWPISLMSLKQRLPLPTTYSTVTYGILTLPGFFAIKILATVSFIFLSMFLYYSWQYDPRRSSRHHVTRSTPLNPPYPVSALPTPIPALPPLMAMTRSSDDHGWYHLLWHHSPNGCQWSARCPDGRNFFWQQNSIGLSWQLLLLQSYYP